MQHSRYSFQNVHIARFTIGFPHIPANLFITNQFTFLRKKLSEDIGMANISKSHISMGRKHVIRLRRPVCKNKQPQDKTDISFNNEINLINFTVLPS